jgi:hypothetical protein
MSHRIGAICGGHGGTPRQELLEAWQALAKIPHHAYVAEAKEMAGHYQSLIAEDKAWKEPDKAAWEKMPVKQKVAYWMYKLRDLNMRQWSDPGQCYVLGDFFGRLNDDDKKNPNPAVELQKLGMDALPDIIAHLDDARPTRCQGHWRSYAPETYVLLRYGDCCQQIFEAITNHTIYDRTTTNGYPIADGKGKDCKARAEVWLENFKKKGEKQVLIEGTAAGDRDSSGHAKRLIEKYPEAAFDAIVQGIKKSSEKWIRSNLVSYLTTVKDERVVAFMLEELKGPALQARVIAAQALVDRGRDEGLRALVAEWKTLQAEDYGWGGFDDGWAVDSLVSSLIATGKLEAFQALGTDLRKKTLYLRWHVLETVARLGNDDRVKVSAEISQAIDKLLVDALQDTERIHSQRLCRKAQKHLNPW